jgi:cobalt-zinc-cadmium efflux system protein
MGQDHDHGLSNIRHEKPLWWALALTCGFLAAELIGAWLTNSLALLSDAAHMATDSLALGIALTAVRLGRRPPDAKRTFGYARLEALGALVNGGLLVLVAMYILWEAIGRFRAPPEIATTGILVIASIGLVVNLIAMRLLKAGSGESLNMKGAYLEVWSDMLGSIAVIIGAGLIWMTGWRIIDPVLAVLIGLWVLPRTLSLVREAVHVLLEGVPPGIDLPALRRAMQAVPGVESIHDLHVWSLSSAQPAIAAHIVVADRQADPSAVRVVLATMLGETFGLHHATLQMESGPCAAPGCESAAGRGTTDAHDHGHDHGTERAADGARATTRHRDHRH